MIKKHLDKNLVRNVVTMVKDSGIDAVGFFMIGFPTETKEEIMNTINFACSLDLERASFHKAMPLPGTELYDLWLAKYSKNQNIDWKTFCVDQFNADWAEVSPKELERLHKLAFFKFYFTKFRVLKFLFNLNANQILKFIKRVMAVLLTSKWYNRIFNRNATNIKFINPIVRKVSKN